MTMLTEPHAPWLRDLDRLFTGEGAVASFIPPADVLVGEDGVMVYMDVPGLSGGSLEIELADGVLTLRIPKPEELEPRRVEIKTASSSSQPQELQESAP